MSRSPMVLLLAMAPLAAAAPEALPARTWSDKASLSFVSLGGNAEGQTLGFANELKITWPNATFTSGLGGVRASATTRSYAAEGTGTAPGQYRVIETTTTATTAETLFANASYDHRIAEAFFWIAGLAWERNVPAGIEGRTMANAGVGYWWVKTEASRFRTDLGLGFTRATPVFDSPGFQDRYASWNLTLNYAKGAGDSGRFTSDLLVTSSLRRGREWLAAWKNAFTTRMSPRLALKVGANLDYNNVPAYRGVDIVRAGSAPAEVLGQAPVQLRKLDMVFTTSLVVTF